ncbi:DNA repair protein RadC [Marivibrio halodurans]|uniref:DNA repair protein RadC n=1 Tax=Marivibrio halodurans TaxID=2039722 RepID=A0A8J7V378_9PROT|nr:DNA repair protein RadC [Marivibrio halodurans]MBP5857667.1 DNA repair protein RadC [Marivibrio halodurans]
MAEGNPPEQPREKPHYHEHRKRLRARFTGDMGASMPDYELLELVLCGIIPRRDVKPIAKALLKRFGGFGDVIGADPREIARVEGMGETSAIQLKAIQQAAIRLLRHEITDGHVLSSWDAVLDYCRAAMGREKVEQFRLLFLNNRNRLIADEVQQTGTVDHTPLYPREVVRRALELGASALVMVHNHPSGDPTPSKADIAMTHAVRDALSKIDIRLHDHIIIGRKDTVSLRSDGLI